MILAPLLLVLLGYISVSKGPWHETDYPAGLATQVGHTLPRHALWQNFTPDPAIPALFGNKTNHQ